MDIESSRFVKLFDRWADTYDADIAASGWGFEYYDEAVEWICFQLETVHQCRKVIDLGCGTATLAEILLKRKSSIEYIGVDISPRMLNIAKKKVSTSSFIQADMRDYSKWDGHLHTKYRCAIVSTYALHHINDIDKINLFKHVFSSSSQQDLLIIMVDYAFLNNCSKIRILGKQTRLGNIHITKEIESEYYANLSTLKNVLMNQSIDLKFTKNGIWDWRFVMQRYRPDAFSFAAI